MALGNTSSRMKRTGVKKDNLKTKYDSDFNPKPWFITLIAKGYVDNLDDVTCSFSDFDAAADSGVSRGLHGRRSWRMDTSPYHPLSVFDVLGDQGIFGKDRPREEACVRVHQEKHPDCSHAKWYCAVDLQARFVFRPMKPGTVADLFDT